MAVIGVLIDPFVPIWAITDCALFMPISANADNSPIYLCASLKSTVTDT